MGLGAPETSKNTLTQTHKGMIVWRHGQSWDRLLTGAWERVGSVVRGSMHLSWGRGGWVLFPGGVACFWGH